MSNRFDICSPRPKKDGGTYWHKIGVAFTDDKGGLTQFFDSYPLPDAEGKVMVKLFPQKDRQQGAQGGGFDPQGIGGDEVPF